MNDLSYVCIITYGFAGFWGIYRNLTKRTEFPTLCRVGMDSATGFVEHSELGCVDLSFEPKESTDEIEKTQEVPG
ncbi:hypothetical protein, partial [Synechococcus sp. W55.1]|uniref:hypothetical protein n=1 Tax=Synechococcus sp. W55.1 TaxID=2964512 RepID=UPI0039C379CB